MTDVLIYAGIFLAGLITGIFVYRNNVNLFKPFAEKLDAKFDEMEEKIKGALKEQK